MSESERDTSPEPPKPVPRQAPTSGSNLQLPPDPIMSDDGHTVTDAKGRKYTRLSEIDYDDLSPPLQSLPRDWKGSRRAWWHRWSGAPFDRKVSRKGSDGDNARNWLFGTFVTHFCDEFFPQLTPGERCEYEAAVGSDIYHLMYNAHRRGHVPKFPDSDDPDELLLKYNGPSRVSVEYLWQKENPELAKELTEKFYVNNPNFGRSAGQRRTVARRVYQESTTAQDKARYQTLVDDENQQIKAGIRLEGEALSRYYQRLPGIFQKYISNAHAVGRVHIMITMVLESVEQPGDWDIRALNTASLKEFRKEPRLVKAMNAMRDFVRQSHGENTDTELGPPLPEIYPNRQGAWEPLVPNPDGLRAFELMTLHRHFWKKLWAFTGADCRFPWGEIAKDIPFWLSIDPEALPGPLRDPSNLGGPINKSWLMFFYGQQTGTDLVSGPLFFRHVLAANPIDPSESQEISRERYMHDGREVWLLSFDKPVGKSHARKMEWPARSIEYADYVENGRTTASLVEFNPLGLPIAPKSQTNLVLIEGEILEHILSHTNRLDANSKTKPAALDLVNAYNDFAAHLPAETERGAWSGGPATPSILPKKPTPIFNILAKFLLPSSFYQPVLKAIKEGTLPFLKDWVDLILASKILHHKRSSTLIGGKTGVIWAVLLLVLLLFNFDYVCGEVPLPIQLPEEYDLSRLPATECQRAVGWCCALTEKLRASQEILSQSSPHRLRIAPSPAVPSNQPVSRRSPTDNTAPTNSLDTNPPPVAAPGTTGKPGKGAKALKSTAKGNATRKKVTGKKGARRQPKRARQNGLDSEESVDFTNNDSEERDYDKEDSDGSDPSEGDQPHDDFNQFGDPATIEGSRPPTSPVSSRLGRPAAVGSTPALSRVDSGARQAHNGRTQGEKDEGYMPLVRDPSLKAADCPWGRFPDPTIDVTLPSPLTRQTLYPRMQASLTEIDQILAAWKQGISNAEKAQAQSCRWALEAPNPAPGDPDLGPLIATVRARESVWNIQKAQGEVLFPILERLSIASSTALQLTMAAAELIKRSKRLIDIGIENAHEWRQFTKFDQDFCTRIAEGRWIVDEMEDYALLATKRSNEVDWFPDSDRRPTFDRLAMRKLAVWCMEWTKETEDLETEMFLRRRRHWSISGRPFLPANRTMSNYKFGNAEKQEWHKDLEGWLVGPAYTDASAVHNDPPLTHGAGVAPETPHHPPAATTNEGTAETAEHLATSHHGEATPKLKPGTMGPDPDPNVVSTLEKEGSQTDQVGTDSAGDGYTGDKSNDSGATSPTKPTVPEPGSETTFQPTSNGSPPAVSISQDKIASKAQAPKPRTARKSGGAKPPEPSNPTRELRSATKRKSEVESKSTQKRTRTRK